MKIKKGLKSMKKDISSVTSRPTKKKHAFGYDRKAPTQDKLRQMLRL